MAIRWTASSRSGRFSSDVTSTPGGGSTGGGSRPARSSWRTFQRSYSAKPRRTRKAIDSGASSEAGLWGGVLRAPRTVPLEDLTAVVLAEAATDEEGDRLGSLLGGRHMEVRLAGLPGDRADRGEQRAADAPSPRLRQHLDAAPERVEVRLEHENPADGRDARRSPVGLRQQPRAPGIGRVPQ